MNAIFRRIKMALDFQKINEAAENYRADMAAFLRAILIQAKAVRKKKLLPASKQRWRS